jgi:hypothetical protein
MIESHVPYTSNPNRENVYQTESRKSTVSPTRIMQSLHSNTGNLGLCRQVSFWCVYNTDRFITMGHMDVVNLLMIDLSDVSTFFLIQKVI